MNPDATSERATSVARVSACLSALEGVLKGTSSFSPIRRYSISFSIAACMDSTIMQIFNAEDLMAIKGHLADLSEVASIEEILHQACDCSCMYFYRDLFPVFIENLYQTILNSSFGHTQLVLSALSDPERILKHASHLEIDELSGSTKSSIGYKNYLFGVVQEEYIDPICEVVEIDLRYVIKHLQATVSSFFFSSLYFSYLSISLSLPLFGVTD